MIYLVKGTVILGKKIGRTIGFPTANIKPDLVECLSGEVSKSIPKNIDSNSSQKIITNIPSGIYASKISFDNQVFVGATSCGEAPFFDFWQKTIETHILDFDQDIYGKHVELILIKKLRDISNYESLELLIAQIQRDCQDSRNIVTL